MDKQEETRNLLVDFRRAIIGRGFTFERGIEEEIELSKLWHTFGRFKVESYFQFMRFIRIESAVSEKQSRHTERVLHEKLSPPRKIFLHCPNHNFGGLTTVERNLIISNCPACTLVRQGLPLELALKSLQGVSSTSQATHS